MKKNVIIDPLAEKEIKEFPREVQIEFQVAMELLAENGRLVSPLGEKLTKDLFAIRIRIKGQWSAPYAYLQNNIIIVLSAFRKKSRKAPLKQIRKAQQRLNKYL